MHHIFFLLIPPLSPLFNTSWCLQRAAPWHAHCPARYPSLLILRKLTKQQNRFCLKIDLSTAVHKELLAIFCYQLTELISKFASPNLSGKDGFLLSLGPLDLDTKSHYVSRQAISVGQTVRSLVERGLILVFFVRILKEN